MNKKKNTKEIKTKGKHKYRALNDTEIGFISAILMEKPYISDADIATSLYSQNYAQDLPRKVLRDKIRYARTKIVDEEIPAVRTRVITHKDGSFTVNRHETGMSTDFSDKYLDEQLLTEMKLDPSQYVLSSYGESEWETAKGDTLHSKRKKFVRLTPDKVDISNLMATTSRRKVMEIFNQDVNKVNNALNHLGLSEILSEVYASFYNSTEIKLNTEGKYSVLLPLTDLHIGEGSAEKMVMSYKATYENLIFPQIHERYFQTTSTSVRTIDIPCLGDIIHCDNIAGTTTAGTALHPHTDVYSSFDKAVDFIEWLIATLRNTFKVPVRLIYVYGNHDTHMGFGIMRVLKAMFKNVEGVDFLINEKLFPNADEDNWYAENEKNPEYLWVPYGNLGITYTHGKFMKKNMKEIPEVANINARKDVDYNVVIYGHLHHIAEGTAGANQHNFGISTPNFVRDKFGRSLGCVTDPEFYIFEVNHHTNRVNYTPIPSLPYNKQRC
jgi:predicted phosphodiesterase